MKRMRTLAPLACVLVTLLASCELAAPTAPPTPTPTPPSSSSPTSAVPSTTLPPTVGLPAGVPATAATPQSTGATPTATPEPGSVDKIEAAERAGKIDHDTALVYELYAALDYGSLPAEYQSNNTAKDPEGTTVLAELADRLDQLPAGLKAKVEPFFKRPTDPQSFWAGRAPAQRKSALSASLAAYSDKIPYEFVDAVKTPVRVWYAAPLGDTERQLAAQLAGEIDSSHMWDKEKKAMLGNTPCSDAEQGNPKNGGNGSLDFYLIYPATGLDWHGRHASIAPEEGDRKGGVVGGVTVAEPGRQCPSVTFIALNAMLPFDYLKDTAAHELFHSFQLSFTYSRTPDRYWWSEASATWAEDLVYPALNLEQSNMQPYWSKVNGASGPLDNAGEAQSYAAYIWPFYVRQKAGGDETVIGQLWEQSGKGVVPIDAMHNLAGWHDKFKEFALWNWNKEPVVKYRDDGKPVPEDVLAQNTTCMVNGKVMKSGEQCIVTVGQRKVNVFLDHDSVEYYAVSPEIDVEQLTFSFAPTPGNDGRGVQAIISKGNPSQPGSSVKTEDWSDLTERKFCLDQEDVRKVVLVISNSSVSGDFLAEDIGLDARKEGCPSKTGLSYTSSSTYGFHYKAPGVSGQIVTGAANTREGVESNWDIRFDRREDDRLYYVFTATNQITLDGSGNWTGNEGKGTTGTTEWQLSGTGVSRNPSLPGDDAYKYGPYPPATAVPTARSTAIPTDEPTARPTATPGKGYAVYSVQPSNNWGMPAPYKRGTIELYKRGGKDFYRIDLGMSQVAPSFTYVSHLSGCGGRMSFTQTYDNVTMQLRSVLVGDRTCISGARSGTLSTGPYMFGFIAVDQHRPSLDMGLGAWIGGTYDPATRLLAGHEAVEETTCARVRGIDPLDGAGLMQTASSYFHPQISDDNAKCESQYILDWHVQLPPPK